MSIRLDSIFYESWKPSTVRSLPLNEPCCGRSFNFPFFQLQTKNMTLKSLKSLPHLYHKGLFINKPVLFPSHSSRAFCFFYFSFESDTLDFLSPRLRVSIDSEKFFRLALCLKGTFCCLSSTFKGYWDERIGRVRVSFFKKLGIKCYMM